MSFRVIAASLSSGVRSLIRASPKPLLFRSSIVSILLGASSGGSYSLIFEPSLRIVIPPLLGDTNGATFLLPSLYSTRTFVVANMSVASLVGKYLSLKNVLIGGCSLTACSN